MTDEQSLQVSDELREEFAHWFAWAYGGEEYAESGASREHWLEVTDEFLAQPFMRRYTAAAERGGRTKARGDTIRRQQVAPVDRCSELLCEKAMSGSSLRCEEHQRGSRPEESA